LTDGIDLGCVTSTADPDTDIDVGELVETNNEEGFVDLESQDFGLDEVERLSVDLNKPFTGLVPYCQYTKFFSLPLSHLSTIRTLQWATAVAIRNFVSTSPSIRIRF